VLPVVIVKGRVDALSESSFPELGSGYIRVEFKSAPGTDLHRLAGECSKAVDAAVRARGIRSGWSVCVVDDQGRVNWPER